MQTFKAYRTFEQDKAWCRAASSICRSTSSTRATSSIRTKYSTINYKDALSYNGAGKIMRKFPTDRRHRHGGHGRIVATTRAGSAATRSSCTGYDLGVSHDGGYSEYVRVPARLGRAAAGEHDGVRRDDARHGRLHRGAGDSPDAAQRPHARQRPGRGDRRDRRRRLGRDRDPREARLPRRRDHRQGARRRDYLRGIGATRSRAARSRSTSPRSARSKRRRGPARSTTSAATSWRGCLSTSKIGGTVARSVSRRA